MAYNNGFPVTYPQMTWPYTQQQQPQGMTPPTIHADIVQVSGETEAWGYPVAAGSSQMMMARDESAIFIKSAFPNTQPVLDVYRKQPSAAQEAASPYVTKEELAEALKGLKTKQEAAK